MIRHVVFDWKDIQNTILDPTWIKHNAGALTWNNSWAYLSELFSRTFLMPCKSIT